MRHPKPAAVLFDLDGLLLDTERLILDLSLQMLSDRGLSVTRDFFLGFVGRNDDDSNAILQQAFPELDVAAFDLDVKQAIIARYEQGIPLKPGVTELLEHLTQTGMPIAIGTNSREKSGQRKLRLSGLDRYFDVLIGFDMVAQPKPAPDIYIAAAARLGTRANQCVIFEDSETGVTAAKAAGGFVIQVPDMIPAQTDRADLVAQTLLEGARQRGLI